MVPNFSAMLIFKKNYSLYLLGSKKGFILLRPWFNGANFKQDFFYFFFEFKDKVTKMIPTKINGKDRT